jgi:hypothetical protein
MIHALGHLVSNAQLLDPNMPAFGWNLVSLKSEFGKLLFFNYDWLGGNLVWLKFLLAVIQWTFVLLVARDIVRWVRGVG